MTCISDLKFSDDEILTASLTGINGQYDCVDLELALEQPEQTITLTKAEIKQLALSVGLTPDDLKQ